MEWLIGIGIISAIAAVDPEVEVAKEKYFERPILTDVTWMAAMITSLGWEIRQNEAFAEYGEEKERVPEADTREP